MCWKYALNSRLEGFIDEKIFKNSVIQTGV
jgi:hypothetical protein